MKTMKNARLNLRISTEDLDKIRRKAQQSGKSLTDYVTAASLGKQIVRIDGLDEVIRQQKALGRNLNRLVTLANMGRMTAFYLEEAVDELTSINCTLQDILERRRWSDGNG